MVPPGLEHDYALVRNLPLFEGIPDGNRSPAFYRP